MRIMLVDDEPFYIDHLKEVIESSRFYRSGEIQIVAECISASLAIEAIPAAHPDLIFTDIKMQSMNGIELATTIREKWPNITVVIVSGYSSFDYARDALRANVDDYLVKPVDLLVIEKILDKALARVNNQSYLRQQHLLKELLDNELFEINPLTIKINFTFPSYHILFIHKQTSFIEREKLVPLTDHEIQNALIQQNLLLQKEKAWVFPRSDPKNTIVILGLSESGYPKIKHIAVELLQVIGSEGATLSIAVSDVFDDLTQIQPIAYKLDNELNHQLVMGHSKRIFLFELPPNQDKSSLLLNSTDEKRIVIAIEKKDWRLLKNVLDHLFIQWEQDLCPSLYLQKNIKKILQWTEKYFRSLDPHISITTEQELGEIVDSAHSFHEAAEAIWSLLSHTFQFEEQDSNSKNGLRLIEQITDYLGANLSELITMTLVMDRFQISSTHLGNLFRKHIGKTFVEYLTHLRIDKAKELMSLYPDMPLKEISEIAGFTDRHYFTKVFKLVTGMPPTEFKDQLQLKPNKST